MPMSTLDRGTPREQLSLSEAKDLVAKWSAIQMARGRTVGEDFLWLVDNPPPDWHFDLHQEWFNKACARYNFSFHPTLEINFSSMPYIAELSRSEVYELLIGQFDVDCDTGRMLSLDIEVAIHAFHVVMLEWS